MSDDVTPFIAEALREAATRLTSTKDGVLASLITPGSFSDLVASGALAVDGDGDVWPAVLSLLDVPDPGFEIVLP